MSIAVRSSVANSESKQGASSSFASRPASVHGRVVLPAASMAEMSGDLRRRAKRGDVDIEVWS